MITEVIQFSNELDLLEAHLEHHRPWGWRTVIAESDRTVMGTPKALYFEANKERFERFDVEYLQIPGDIFKPAAGYRQFRDNDWLKERWMHENFDPKNPWLIYADTDEIITEQPADFEDVDYVSFVIDERTAQVNRRTRHWPEVYRLHRSDITVEQLVNPRLLRRKCLGRGWHFMNCPSRPEDMLIKAQCRHWYFNVPRPEDAPGVEHFRSLFGQDVDYITGKKIENSQVVTTRELPRWMQQNLHLFPVAANPVPDTDIPGRIKKNIELFGQED
jgi:hypothetical protein